MWHTISDKNSELWIFPLVEKQMTLHIVLQKYILNVKNPNLTDLSRQKLQCFAKCLLFNDNWQHTNALLVNFKQLFFLTFLDGVF